jgi:hypothetical protein
MAKRTTATGNAFGPIIPLEDGVTILARVMNIRTGQGEFKSKVVDLEDGGGNPFSVNGHLILVDKIEQFFVGAPEWFEITRDGTAGQAAMYHVDRLDGTHDDIIGDKAERKLHDATCEWVAAQIAALPPRD